jgi:hypothetical protein
MNSTMTQFPNDVHNAERSAKQTYTTSLGAQLIQRRGVIAGLLGTIASLATKANGETSN